MRYLYALIGLLLALCATGAAGSFKANLDVDTYVDAQLSNQSFSEDDALLIASEDGKPAKEAYLSFQNLFGSQGIFKPEQIKSATLTFEVSDAEKPGKINAYFVHGATFETATWMDKPEYSSDVSAFVDVKSPGSYEVNVTPLVQKAVETCAEGCPFSIALVAEDGTSVSLTSSRASEEKKPALEYEISD